jgi:hypothetical protein
MGKLYEKAFTLAQKRKYQLDEAQKKYDEALKALREAPKGDELVESAIVAGRYRAFEILPLTNPRRFRIMAPNADKYVGLTEALRFCAAHNIELVEYSGPNDKRPKP